MKIVPLDKPGKFVMQLFLQHAPHHDTSRMLYRTLNSVVLKSGNPRFTSNKQVSGKMKRILIDIYKRICLKIARKKQITIDLQRQMQEKIVIVIRHFYRLNTKDIFLKICHRYVGHHQLGQVSQDQQIQFYQEVNKEVVKDTNLRRDLVNFQQQDWQKNQNGQQQKLSLFANGLYEDEFSDDQKQSKKKNKNWEHQIQKQIKKVQQDIKNAKQQRIHENQLDDSKQKIQHSSKVTDKNADQTETEVKKQSFQLQDSDNQNSQKDQTQKTESKNIEKIKLEKSTLSKGQIKQKQIKKQQVKSSKSQLKMQKRKKLKIKGPKDTKPTQIKSDDQIWSDTTYKSLCQQFLLHENNLINLAKQFSIKQNIVPAMSAKQLSERLLKLMSRSFKIYCKICQKLFRKKFQVTDLFSYQDRYLEKLFMSSSGSLIHKKLLRIYMNHQDPQFELNQKQGYEIFLHMRQGLRQIILKQDQNLCDENQLLNLFTKGDLQFQQPQPKKRHRSYMQYLKGNELQQQLKKINSKQLRMTHIAKNQRRDSELVEFKKQVKKGRPRKEPKLA